MFPKESTNPKLYILLLSAGSGSRMKNSEKKQFLSFNNKPLFIWAVKTFLDLQYSYPTKLLLMYSPNDKERFEEHLSQHLTPREINRLTLAPGGATRSHSVYNGLQHFANSALPEDFILIHDCARPFIQKTDIIPLIESLYQYQAATLGYSVIDTIKSVEIGTNEVKEHLKRDHLKGILTPQGFHFSVIWKAYQQYMDNPYPVTDDTQLATDIGVAVQVVEGARTNIKITTPEDLLLAEAYFSQLRR